jgi:hypothetical protein
MKHVQIFWEQNHRDMQVKVNDFIQFLGPLGIVHDIKFNTVATHVGEIYHSAMVIFSFEEITA